MKRREFLRDATRMLLVLPFGTFVIAACGDDDSGGTTATTNPTSPTPTGPLPDAPPKVVGDNVVYTSSQTNAHSHSFSIPRSDFVVTPPAAGRFGATTEAQFHSHQLNVSQADLVRAAAGESVQIETSSVLDHTHTFTIVRV